MLHEEINSGNKEGVFCKSECEMLETCRLATLLLQMVGVWRGTQLYIVVNMPNNFNITNLLWLS